MIIACLFALDSAYNPIRLLDKEKQDLYPETCSFIYDVCKARDYKGSGKKIGLFSLGLKHMDYKEDCCVFMCVKHNINIQVTQQ